MKKLLFVPPVALGVAMLVYAAGLRQPPEREALSERTTPVAVIEIAPRRVVPRVDGFGTVAPARSWQAVPQVPGRIAEIHPDLTRGGTVARGDLLLRISPETYEAAVAEARANLAAVTADIRELALTGETTRASLEIEAEALQLAERELERQQSLEARGTVPQVMVDTQRRAMLQQRARVQDLRNRLDLLPARREALQQTREVARIRLRVAQLDLARTKIRAPFDARVARASAQIRQFVATGAPVATLDDLAAAEIDAQIAPSRMSGFVRLAAGRDVSDRPGTFAAVSGRLDLAARVTLASGSGTGAHWDAEVTRISDTVDPQTRSVGVIVTVRDPYGSVVPGQRPPLIKGMFTRVELRGPAQEGRYLVPRSAVRDGRVMIVDADDRLGFSQVEVVHTMADVAVLGDGLSPGTRVVVSDPTPAIVGMLLDPRPAPDVVRRIARAADPGRTPP